MAGIWDEKKYTKVLSDLVKIPSMSGDEGKLAEYIAAFLRSNKVPCEKDKDDNVIAKVGKGKPAIHLVGHTDTVPPVSKWESNPYKPVVKGGKLYGLGSSDMKSGLAVMMNLATMLKPEKGTVYFDFTVVEENPVKHKDNGAKKAAQKYPADAAITLEPSVVGEDGPQLEIGCQGSFTATVVTRGSSCHSSVPWKGKNAIYQAAKLALRVEEMNNYDWEDYYKGAKRRSAISATTIHGGTAWNVIPDRVAVTVNRRTGPNETRVDFEKDLQELLEGLDAEVEQLEGVEGAVTDLDGQLLPAAEEAFQSVTKKEPVFRFAQGRTDAVYFKFAGADVLTIGPGTVETIHRENEWVIIRKMPETAAIVKAIIQEYIERTGK